MKASVAIITFGIIAVLAGIVGLFFKELSFYGSLVCVSCGLVMVGIGER